MACTHEAEPYPTFIVVDRGQPIPDPLPEGWEVIRDASPLPQVPPSRYVPCIHCGAPLDRGRWVGLMSDPYAGFPVLPDEDDG